MKVAICLSGQLRTFAQCLASQDKNLFQPLQPDIFVHTWDTVGVTHKTQQITDPQASAHLAENKVTEEILLSNYHPTAFRIETFNQSYYNKLGGASAPQELIEQEPVRYKGALPMTYGMKQSLMLMQKEAERAGSPYDLVFRLRPDLQILEPIPQRLLLQPDTLWWPRWPDLDPASQVSDKLAFSSPANMDYYLRLVDYVPEYWKNPIGDKSWKNIMVGERLMGRHIRRAHFANTAYEQKLEIPR